MKALLLGSISVLSDTSELQRAAFNQAFNEAGLDWYWTQEAYREMLTRSGGGSRVAEYAKRRGALVDAAALHRHKTEIFQDALEAGGQFLRPLTAQAIDEARAMGLPVAVVSSTDKRSIDALISSLGGAEALGIAEVITAANGFAPKPAPDPYLAVLTRLGIGPGDAIAIEDNLPGIRSAMSAGISTFSYPNENTGDHDLQTVPHVREMLTAHAA